MLRNFLRFVDLGCDTLTLLALPAIALLWLSGSTDILQAHWVAAKAGGSSALWLQASALYMAVISRSITRERAELHVRTLLSDWRAAGHERLRRFGSALCVWPWCLYVLWSGAPAHLQPALQAGLLPPEKTALLHTILWSAALLLTLHSMLDIFAPRQALRAPADPAGSP